MSDGGRLSHVGTTAVATAVAAGIVGAAEPLVQRLSDEPASLTSVAAGAALMAGVGALVGALLGAVLAGVAGALSLLDVRREMIAFLRIDHRSAETRKVADLVAGSMAVGSWLAAGVFLVRTLVLRLANPKLEAVAVCLALLGLAVVVRGLAPLLRDALVEVLSWRGRILSSQTGVCSVAWLTAAVLVAAGAGLIVARERVYNLLYALNLAPLAVLSATTLLSLLLLFILSLEWSQRLAARLGSGWAVLIILPALGAAAFAGMSVRDDEALRELVLEDSSIAGALASLLVADAGDDEPVSVAAMEEEDSEEEDQEPDVPTVTADPEPLPTRPRPHVIIVSMDTVRADHVGAYGYNRNPTTPNVDAFAARGTLFKRAYASGPCSSASFIGMLTGRLHSRVPGLRRDGDTFILPPSATTMAERFRDGGYHTRALIPVISDYLDGLDDGFERFDSKFHYAPALADKAIHVLQTLPDDKPTFLWVHFVDAHFPYESHRGFTQFGNEPKDLYDQELAFMDVHVGRVLQAIPEGSIVAIVADHGEAFGEHGTRLHGNSLHEEEIRVPFILVGPDVPAQVVEEPVSLLDLSPTLLKVAGVDFRGRADGKALTSALTGMGAEPPRNILVEGCKPGTMMALIGQQKLFYRRKSGLYFFYDLTRDPREKRNLFKTSEQAKEWAATVRAELARGVSRAN